MSLPPADELSRWTVSQVSNWLTQNGLSVFRDEFQRDRIDGCKLMKMHPQDVDAKFPNVKLAKQKKVLKDHLGKIESLRSPLSWNSAAAAPQLPPRPGGGRPPPPVPQQQDDGDYSDDGWDTDFEEDFDEEYIEPMPPLAHPNQAANQEPNGAFAPPLPPPRKSSGADAGPSYMNSGQREQGAAAAPTHGQHRPLPQPTPASQGLLPPDDVYEIPAAPQTQKLQAGSRNSQELPPLPGNRKHSSLPPPPPPATTTSSSSSSMQQQGGWLFSNTQANLAPSPDDLSAYEWYHGKISRANAETIFHREQRDGMFLIRKSERDPQQPFTLVLWHLGRIWNIPIRKVAYDKFAAGKFKPDETHFDSLPALVDHFKMVSLNLKSNDQVQGSHCLTVPAPRHR